MATKPSTFQISVAAVRALSRKAKFSLLVFFAMIILMFVTPYYGFSKSISAKPDSRWLFGIGLGGFVLLHMNPAQVNSFVVGFWHRSWPVSFWLPRILTAHVRIDRNVIAIPYWFIAAISLPLPAIQFCQKYRRIRRQLLIGCCQHCGYDLRASPNRCPECGYLPNPQPQGN